MFLWFLPKVFAIQKSQIDCIQIITSTFLEYQSEGWQSQNGLRLFLRGFNKSLNKSSAVKMVVLTISIYLFMIGFVNLKLMRDLPMLQVLKTPFC